MVFFCNLVLKKTDRLHTKKELETMKILLAANNGKTNQQLKMKL